MEVSEDGEITSTVSTFIVIAESEDGEITSELLAVSCTEDHFMLEWDNREIKSETPAETTPEIPFVIGSKNLNLCDNTISLSKFKSYEYPFD